MSCESSVPLALGFWIMCNEYIRLLRLVHRRSIMGLSRLDVAVRTFANKKITNQGADSMERLKILWIDMMIATRHSELDPIFDEYFDIRYGPAPNRLDVELDPRPGEVLVFEFDYPDRPGLSILRNTKQRFPQIPILMLTTQHSERLAVWAYRNRVMDYLTTPVKRADLDRFSHMLQKIQNADGQQRDRTIIDFESGIPFEIPVGQRAPGVRLGAALHFVQMNFRRKIRAAEVAELCDMSSFHFSHEFTDTFSLSFQEYVMRHRILEACKELRHPNIAVANVAYSVGFNDPSYFARVFRRYIGLSPSEYCEQIRHGECNEQIEELANRLQLPTLASIQEQGQPGKLQQVEPQRHNIGRAAKY